jgi:hypothetical protein
VREAGGPGRIDGAHSAPDVLSPRNREHLRFVEAEISAFPETCRGLLGRSPLPDRVAVRMNQVANELLTISVTLARAATLAAQGSSHVQDLADVYCATARHRLADWWRQASDDDEPDYARAAVNWLKDGRPELLLGDVLTQLPPTCLMEEVQ